MRGRMLMLMLTLFSLAFACADWSDAAFAATGYSARSGNAGIIFADVYSSLAGLSEYKFDIEGSQIFPNETIKNDIVNGYRQSEYNITTLEYDIMGYHINASDVKIAVDPSRVDDQRTRIDLDIRADQTTVTGANGLGRSYDEIDLDSVYGVYDKTTEKITVHVPLSEALSFLW
jgi:hypothetical protein